MPQRVMAQVSVADNLCQLAKEFKSGDQVMANAIRKEFKTKSFNDVTRAVVYLMEVIGSRDEQFKYLQKENADLKELLKLNNISLEENNEGTAPSTKGSDGMATAGTNQGTGNGELAVSGEANVTT